MSCNQCTPMSYCQDEMVKVDNIDLPGWLNSKLRQGNNITLTVEGAAGARYITIDGPDIPEQAVVESTDGTVNVSFDGVKTYDLSVDCCDIEDKYVAVAQGCTPGYLQNQIVAQPGSPILVGVNGGCEVEIGFDESALTIQDEKVALTSSCTPGYLSDVLSTGDGLTEQDTSCERTILLDKNWVGYKRPRAKIRVENSQRFTDAIDTESAVILGGLSLKESHSDFPEMINTTSNRIYIPTTGQYLITVNGNIEFNDSTHAMRVVSFISGAGEIGGTDVKYGGSYTSGQINGGGGPIGNKGSLGNPQGGSNILPFNATNITRLSEGDEIGVLVKYSSYVHGDYRETDGIEFLVVGALGGDLTPSTGSDFGFSISVHYIGDFI